MDALRRCTTTKPPFGTLSETLRRLNRPQFLVSARTFLPRPPEDVALSLLIGSICFISYPLSKYESPCSGRMPNDDSDVYVTSVTRTRPPHAAHLIGVVNGSDCGA